MTKLSAEDIEEIKKDYKLRFKSQTEIARRYGVDPSHISRIVRGEYEKPLTP